jgi:hypothetical protein
MPEKYYFDKKATDTKLIEIRGLNSLIGSIFKIIVPVDNVKLGHIRFALLIEHGLENNDITVRGKKIHDDDFDLFTDDFNKIHVHGTKRVKAERKVNEEVKNGSVLSDTLRSEKDFRSRAVTPQQTYTAQVTLATTHNETQR